MSTTKPARALALLLFCASLPVAAAPAKASPAKAPAAKAPALQADDSGRAPFSILGLGIFLGQPTGITAALNLAARQWIDLKAAWNFGGPGGGTFTLQGNYIMSFPGIVVIKEFDIPPFVGFGVSAGFSDAGVGVAIRVPFGVDLVVPKTPIEVFLELGLGMTLVPDTSPDVTGGFGLRYRL